MLRLRLFACGNFVGPVHEQLRRPCISLCMHTLFCNTRDAFDDVSTLVLLLSFSLQSFLCQVFLTEIIFVLSLVLFGCHLPFMNTLICNHPLPPTFSSPASSYTCTQ